MIYDVEINSAAHYPADEVVGLVEIAEDAGFGAFWKGESNSTDPIVMLSAVASRTKSIAVPRASSWERQSTTSTVGAPSRWESSQLPCRTFQEDVSFLAWEWRIRP